MNTCVSRDFLSMARFVESAPFANSAAAARKEGKSMVRPDGTERIDRPLLRPRRAVPLGLAISVAPLPELLSCLTSSASIEAGRPL